MSRLIAIRHAQASFMAEDYDQLSDLGYMQAAQLGDYLADVGMTFDKIYVGPLKRHWQTLSKVQEAYAKRGIALPEPIQIDELAEHVGMHVMDVMMPKLLQKNTMMQQWKAAADADPTTKKKNHLRIFTLFMELWAKDELDIEHPPNLQPWKAFRQMVNTGLEKIMQDAGRGTTVAAFTSGGTISAKVGYSLEIEKENRVIELNGHVKNTSMTEFLFSKEKISLKTFNEIPHLVKKEMITYV